MRRISLVLIVLIGLGSVHLSAEPLRGGREERGPFVRFIRVVKAIFGVQTNGDGLIPPVPVQTNGDGLTPPVPARTNGDGLTPPIGSPRS